MISRLALRYFILNQRRSMKGSHIVAIGFIAIFATTILLNGFSSEISIISSKLGKEDLSYNIIPDGEGFTDLQIDQITILLKDNKLVQYFNFEYLQLINISTSNIQTAKVPIHITDLSKLKKEGMIPKFNLVEEEKQLFVTTDLQNTLNLGIDELMSLNIDNQTDTRKITQFIDPFSSVTTSGIYISNLQYPSKSFNLGYVIFSNNVNHNSIIDQLEKIKGLQIQLIRSETRFLEISATNIRNTLLILQVVISLLVFLSIFNLMRLIILESRYDIRVLLSLGFSRIQVWRLFVSIGALIGIVGSILTILISILIVGVIQASLAVLGFPFIVMEANISDILLVVLNSFLVTLISSIYPSYQGVRAGK